MALVLPNVPQFTVAYFGCHYAGNPVVPLNVLLTADELAYHLDDSEADDRGHVGPVPPRRAAGRRRRPHRHRGQGRPGRPLGARGHPQPDRPDRRATPVDAAHPTTDDDTAVILYTSGTTGRAKGAELTHANLLANAKVPHQLVGLGDETVALVALPLFHAFGMTVMHNAVLAVGGTLVLLPRFTAGDAAALIARHRVTFFGGVPTMYIALLQQAGRPVDACAGASPAGRRCPPR